MGNSTLIPNSITLNSALSNAISSSMEIFSITKKNKDEDLELVRQAVGGNRDAFRTLVEKHQSKMFFHALAIVKSREDAEDVVQEAMVKAYLALPKFEGKSSFSTWLKKIVVNFAIDWRRKKARRGGTHEELDELNVKDVDQRFDPSLAYFRGEETKRINGALKQISPEHRDVIVLREVDGLSYEEIARVTGVSVGTIMSRLHYARKKLQAVLTEADEVKNDGDKYGT